jgi:hypothetical protein
MPDHDPHGPRGRADPYARPGRADPYALRRAAAEAARIRLEPPPGIYLAPEQSPCSDKGFVMSIGLTAALAEGAIQPCDVPAGAGTVPEGTTASRCRSCGETRLHHPGDTTDPWKKHFDYCDGATEALEA